MVHRVRFTAEPMAFRLLAVPVVLIWGEAITTRRFLRGVRSRAEELPHDQTQQRGPSDGQSPRSHTCQGTGTSP
jgi:hypothetical protein